MHQSNTQKITGPHMPISQPKEIAIITFYTRNGRIAMEDRKFPSDISKYGEEFAFFGGKRKDVDSSIEDTLFREVNDEELGYLPEEHAFLRDYSIIIGGKFQREFFYVAELPDMNKFTGQEANRMKLFTIPEARKLKLMPNHYNILNDLEAYMNGLL